MKRFSALLIGALMIFGASSAIALEGSNDFQLAPSSSAISAMQSIALGTPGERECKDLPIAGNGGEGIAIENQCYTTFGQGNVASNGPQFDTPQN